MAAVEQAEPEQASAVLDLTGISLEELRSLDGPEVIESLDRLMEELDDPHSVRNSGGSPSRAW
ncbi:hypothetical protein AB0G67_45135 [Streptomyces sp. NPDC021056]|uniref:hypothetical protein n=1 Tax=Streptomyces sp. NPDC021056 TaxID=3155012 RepID=UPI00340890DC